MKQFLGQIVNGNDIFDIYQVEYRTMIVKIKLYRSTPDCINPVIYKAEINDEAITDSNIMVDITKYVIYEDIGKTVYEILKKSIESGNYRLEKIEKKRDFRGKFYDIKNTFSFISNIEINGLIIKNIPLFEFVMKED